MNILHLVWRELRFRPLNFSLGVLAVTIAVTCLIGSLTLLRIFDWRSSQILADKTAALKAQMDALQDDTRKITLNLGFNLLIVPRDQQLSDFYADDFAAKLMPESYVDRLAHSGAITVQHILPVLQRKILWPERKRTILLTGTEGEVPIIGEDAKKPMLEKIAPGSITLGYELQQSLNLSAGDKVTLLGEPFTIIKCNPQRGTKDDITAWINLADAQRLLKEPAHVNAIFALSCQCTGDPLASIRSEVAGILPETQVVEFASSALTRAEARNRSELAAQDALDSEKTHQKALRAEQQHLIGTLVPLALLGCILWIGLLAFGNVRERRAEIGILRAFGVHTLQVQALFLWRSLLIGFLGALLGSVIGFVVGIFIGRSGGGMRWAFDPNLFIAVLILAPLLAALASWMPAMLGARQDPAQVLGEE